MVATPLIYTGGKTLLLPEIRKVTPPHEYALDLFGGGGAWILDGTDRMGVYNDINGEAVNFFRVMRDPSSAQRLYDLLRNTPYSREEYFACDSTWEQVSDPVERARRWFVVINLGFTHQEDCHSFRVGVKNGVAKSFRNHIDDLPEVHSRLRNVVIENLDFRRALAIYGNGSDRCVFADPEYINPNPDAVSYRHTMSIRDHFDLLTLLSRTDAQVVLCGYESELYYDLLRPPMWQLVRKVRVAQVGNSGYKDRDVRVEHIWVKKHLGGMWS